MVAKTMSSGDKYFWKIEDVNMELEQQINKSFSQIGIYLKVNNKEKTWFLIWLFVLGSY